MLNDQEERTVDLTLAEIEILQALVQYKTENVIEHSPEYFQLQDLAFKLASAHQLRGVAHK